ncbi:hypothetical protein [Kitasatospora terrestris]|uniref:Uncharacterized protein n=1 Tax=Kitasatospora terrestris TaxID=258051 RepID=A0ABP9D9C0_9ACTN
MDIVYASLMRRGTSAPRGTGEAAEIIDALWAHATPDDGLEHAGATIEPDRVDLLLYLLSRTPPDPTAPSALQRASALLIRCHQASPRLHQRYLPPAPPAASTRTVR